MTPEQEKLHRSLGKRGGGRVWPQGKDITTRSSRGALIYGNRTSESNSLLNNILMALMVHTTVLLFLVFSTNTHFVLMQ